MASIDLMALYVHQKMSTKQIHRATGMAMAGIRRFLLAAGVMRTQPEAVRLAASEGRLGNGCQRGVKRTSEQRQRTSEARLQWGAKNAKGLSLKPSGYLEYTRGTHKGRKQHAVVMEQEIGRRLLPHEVVHHKDGDRSNNRLENLELMTRAEHMRHHALERAPTQKRNRHGKFE